MKFGEDNLNQTKCPPLSLERAHQSKKQCQSDDTSQATALTTNTNKKEEMETKFKTMSLDLIAKLQRISTEREC
jgi:hypothetical protein